jgi:16S rRNA (cytidine1402-2'-O)-methyltransferase
VDGHLVSGTLHVVATPLGNLGDLSTRAIAVLRSVALVAAEDTRRARVLLQHVGARPDVVSFHAHSHERRLEAILARLVAGEEVALVTDAGTPTVSDPGTALVRRARAAGISVVTVPGPTAVAAALAISGLPADRYTFLGFPPRKGRERRALLATVADTPWTCVLFESPNRVVTLLHDLAAVCGDDREAAVGRELTKVHEELVAGNLARLAGYYQEHPPRGEVTVVVAGRSPGADEPPIDESTLRRRAEALLSEGVSRRDAAARLAAEFPVGKREAYRIVTSL